jgi:SH3-like domain-containing protein
MGGRGLGSLLMAFACVGVAAAAAYSLFGQRASSEVRPSPVEVTGSLSNEEKAQAARGSSGLPVPRFVSLKTDTVNVRRGPSSEHAIAWVFKRKGLPVEIIAEFEHWRRIRDSEGEEGWVYMSMLAGNRTVIVAPWKKEQAIAMRHRAEDQAATLAMLKSGVIGEVSGCTGDWCEMSVEGYDGWVEQSQLFGVYPGEKIAD